MRPSDVRELKQLRDEVTKLKLLVAGLSPEKVMLRSDKVLEPVKQREAIYGCQDPSDTLQWFVARCCSSLIALQT